MSERHLDLDAQAAHYAAHLSEHAERQRGEALERTSSTMKLGDIIGDILELMFTNQPTGERPPPTPCVRCGAPSPAEWVGVFNKWVEVDHCSSCHKVVAHHEAITTQVSASIALDAEDELRAAGLTGERFSRYADQDVDLDGVLKAVAGSRFDGACLVDKSHRLRTAHAVHWCRLHAERAAERGELAGLLVLSEAQMVSACDEAMNSYVPVPWEQWARAKTLVILGVGDTKHTPPNFPRICRDVFRERFDARRTTVVTSEHEPARWTYALRKTYGDGLPPLFAMTSNVVVRLDGAHREPLRQAPVEDDWDDPNTYGV